MTIIIDPAVALLLLVFALIGNIIGNLIAERIRGKK